MVVQLIMQNELIQKRSKPRKLRIPFEGEPYLEAKSTIRECMKFSPPFGSKFSSAALLDITALMVG
jgi:hypothetical protein